MGLATALDTEIGALLNDFVNTKSAAVSEAIVPWAIAAITIYITLAGFRILQGDPLGKMVMQRTLSIAFIVAIALSAGTYQEHVAGTVNAIPNALAEMIGNAASVPEMIDSVSKPYSDLYNTVFGEASTGVWPNIILLIAGIIVLLSHVALMISAIGLLLTAKVTLALLLAIGPIFVLLTLFDSTRRLFEGWFSQTLNMAVLQGLIGCAIAMFFKLPAKLASDVAAQLGTGQILTDAGALFACTVVICWIMVKLPAISSAITGGISLSDNASSPLGSVAKAAGKAFQKAADMGANASGKAWRKLTTRSSGGSISRVEPTMNNNSFNAPDPTPIPSEPMYNRHALENIKKASQ